MSRGLLLKTATTVTVEVLFSVNLYCYGPTWPIVGLLGDTTRFIWDVQNVPWADCKGNQEEYANAVELQRAFHDKLPDSNLNKIPAELRVIMPQYQLYGQARNICRSIADSEIQSGKGWKKIVEAFYKN